MTIFVVFYLTPIVVRLVLKLVPTDLSKLYFEYCFKEYW